MRLSTAHGPEALTALFQPVPVEAVIVVIDLWV
jgi:hypothetical protein